MEERGFGMGVEKNVLVTSVDFLVNWARKNALWPVSCGLACCAIEGLMIPQSSTFDVSRFGAEVMRPSPRQADLLIIAGNTDEEDGAHDQKDLRADARAEMGNSLRGLRVERRHIQDVQRGAGRGPGPAGRRLRPGMPAEARGLHSGVDEPSEEDRRKRASSTRTEGSSHCRGKKHDSKLEYHEK